MISAESRFIFDLNSLNSLSLPTLLSDGSEKLSNKTRNKQKQAQKIGTTPQCSQKDFANFQHQLAIDFRSQPTILNDTVIYRKISI
jgi:hypothetical protein